MKIFFNKKAVFLFSAGASCKDITSIFGLGPAWFINTHADWHLLAAEWQYSLQDKYLDKSHLYISSYWKKGLQEEEHQGEQSK